MSSNVDLANYTIPVDKLASGENKRIALLADLHDVVNNKKLAEDLKASIAETLPDVIVISGDLMQGNKYLMPSKIEELKYFLASLSEVAPVVLSQGNHDLTGFKSSQKDEVDAAFKKLDSARPGEVFPLINDCIIINGMEIISYVTTHKIMATLSTQIHGLAHDEFMEDYNKNGRYKFSSNSGNVNVFIGHNPHLIAASENGVGLDNLSLADVILAGHLHNGYLRSSDVEKNPDKYLDKGYVEQPYLLDASKKVTKVNPLFYGKSNLCRGCVYVDENSKQVILQLRNDHYYLNLSDKPNEQNWVQIKKKEALDVLNAKHYSALVINGGINKFFGFNIPGDKPEIDDIVISGTAKKM